jgi:hypothetical protein
MNSSIYHGINTLQKHPRFRNYPRVQNTDSANNGYTRGHAGLEWDQIGHSNRNVQGEYRANVLTSRK